VRVERNVSRRYIIEPPDVLHNLIQLFRVGWLNTRNYESESMTEARKVTNKVAVVVMTIAVLFMTWNSLYTGQSRTSVGTWRLQCFEMGDVRIDTTFEGSVTVQNGAVRWSSAGDEREWIETGSCSIKSHQARKNE